MTSRALLRTVGFALAGALLALAVPVRARAEQQLFDGEKLRVQLVPRQQATLSSEVSAKIEKLPLKEGDSFAEGDLLVAFDCAVPQAQLRKSEAAAEGARQTLKVNARLAELNSISTLEVDQAAAKLKEAEAEVSAMTLMVSKCTLPAPYGGRVAKLHASPHEYLTPGKPILDILDTSRLEVRLIAPSRWLSWLKQGARFTVHIDEVDRSYKARVLRVGARVDPLSQSIPVIGEIDGAAPELLAGMSGWTAFPRARK